MRFGISQKIVFVFVLLIISLEVITGFYFVSHEKKTLLEEFNERAQALTQGLAVTVEYPVLVGDEQTLEVIGKGALEQKDVVSCKITDKDGRILFEGGSQTKGYIRKHTLPILTEKPPALPTEALLLGRAEKEFEEIGSVCLVVSLLDLREKLSAAKTTMAIFVTAGAALASLLIVLLVRLVLSKPITKLLGGIERISEGDLRYKVSVESRDEIGQLADAFNDMTEHLQQTTTSIDDLNREITDRKRAEEALWESQERYRALVDNTVLGITVMDANHKIIMTNATFAKLFKKPASSFVGKYCFREYEKREAVCPHCPGVRAMASGNTAEVETQAVLDDGSRINVRNRAIPFFGPDGVAKGFVEIVENIDERKKAEQRQAELLEQLENTNQELKDFAYVVSHDLKAPLRGIKTLANWLSTDYADKLDEDGKEQFDLLSSRVDRMHNLIDGILQYSRIGRVKEEKVLVNLNKLVPNIIDSLDPGENVAVTIENELPTIEFGHTHIIQVFQNLLSNAIKYMDKPQGQIKIDCIEEDGSWEFRVADNGPGIEEKYFEKIFQMFQTLSPRDEFESTGVGLTLVKKIVDSHGGKIWVKSNVGEGSTFFFTLPKSEMGVKDEKLQANIVS